MRRFLKFSRHGEKGFTLVELLIVVAILGILAAVIIPNVAGFLVTGTLNAANTEAENVKTAALAYYAEHGTWEGVSADDATGYAGYLTGTRKANYDFYEEGENAGCISAAVTTGASGWPDTIRWDNSTPCAGKWVRGTPP